jgi:hypothetical protein
MWKISQEISVNFWDWKPHHPWFLPSIHVEKLPEKTQEIS